MAKQFLVAAVAALAAAAPTAEQQSQGMKIALPERRSLQNADGTVNFKALLSEFDRTLVKYGKADHVPFAQQLRVDQNGEIFPRATGTVPLTDQVDQGQDELYFGNAGVNTQTFTVDFDTGSADFFVPGPSCGAAQGCVGTTKYNQKGRSEGNTTSVTYGSGMVSGNNYFDTVTVGGLSAPNTNVISLTNAQGFSSSNSEGLMGMGFSTIANSGQPTFFENLIKLGKVTQQEFSFYLGRAASNTQSGSELYLGGANSAKYKGALTSIPVTKKGYWQVALQNVVVGGSSAFGSAGQAAIDTGTTIILAPSASAASIFSKIPGSQVIQFGGGETIYSYPCNSNPKVAITFGGKQYAINILDFNLGQVSSGSSSLFGSLFGGAASGPQCAAAIFGADIDPTQNLYVVGDSFLKNWYSVYSYVGGASVSFAPAVGNQ